MSRKISKKSTIRNVWMITREYDGLAGAGGVKDVCRQLSEALVEHGGCRVSVVLPRYGFITPGSLGFSPLPLSSSRPAARAVDVFAIDMDYATESRRESVSVWSGERGGVRIFLIEAERFAEKLGVYTYTGDEEKKVSWQKKGAGHFDYFAMNVLLQKASLALMMVLGEQPDVVHCQDGHTALIPAMMREKEGFRYFFRSTGCVVSIHNAGTGYHQEVGDLAFARAVTGLPAPVIQGALLSGSFDPFLAASGYALMNTVSEQYALELQETKEDIRTGWLGHALKERDVTLAGITNGINPDDFDPAKPEKIGLKAGFDVKKGRFKGKQDCKQFLLRSLSSRRKRANVEQFGRLSMKPDQPLYTFIGRLTHQKGVDLLTETFAELMEADRELQLLVLGSGEPDIEAELIQLAEDEKSAGQVCFLQGYDQDLALKIYAAGDFFIIPSLFEPCGLTDYIAQLLGNIPVVHYVGGLVKVIDGMTGFTYSGHNQAALAEALGKTLTMYRNDPEGVRRMQQRAVQQIHEQHTWKKVMGRYLDLYGESIAMARMQGSRDKR